MLIHPVACVLLDVPISHLPAPPPTPPALLRREITFCGLNSHLISFIFNQPLHPFFFASYFQEPPRFLAFPGVLRRCEPNVWLQYTAPGGCPSWSSRSGCWGPGSACKGRETVSSAHVPVFNWAIHSYLLLPLWAVCTFPFVSTFMLS